MKKQLIVLFLLSTCFVTYSQFEYYKPEITKFQHQTGDIIVSATPNLLLKTPNGIQIAGGLKFQIFISKRFSLDADLVLGRDYFHSGPGLIAIPYWLLKSTGIEFENYEGYLAGFLFIAAATVLSLEHISYHIPVKSNLDISPYVSLLRYKYAYGHDNHSNPDVTGEQLSLTLGLEINKYFGRFVLSPYTEYNIGYKDHIPGFNIGIYCGIYFPTK